MRNDQFQQRYLPEQSIVRPFRPIGTGGQFVYCYYFPYVRRLRQKAGERTWPCKIGKAVKQSVSERVSQQIHQESCFEKPIVGFIAETENAKRLEEKMRDWFPVDRKLNYENGERVIGVGTEWVEANLAEVRKAYRAITFSEMYPKWYHWPARVKATMRMEYSAWRDERLWKKWGHEKVVGDNL